jgi:hypothetical protein
MLNQPETYKCVHYTAETRKTMEGEQEESERRGGSERAAETGTRTDRE